MRKRAKPDAANVTGTGLAGNSVARNAEQGTRIDDRKIMDG